MALALALDLGTTSISAVAATPEGRLDGKVVLPNDTSVTGLPSGRAEQNPRRLHEIAVESLRQLAKQITDRPHCLGITGQMHSVVLLDAARRPLSRVCT